MSEHNHHDRENPCQECDTSNAEISALKAKLASADDFLRYCQQKHVPLREAIDWKEKYEAAETRLRAIEAQTAEMRAALLAKGVNHGTSDSPCFCLGTPSGGGHYDSCRRIRNALSS